MIRRRVIAAAFLFAFAIGSSLFWNDGKVDLFEIAINVGLASAGMVFLHYRWRSRERRELTPDKAKGIFE